MKISGKTFPWGVLAACAVALGIVLLTTLGEKVPINGGAGWDGEFYREVARSFSSDFTTYDRYRVQRVLPFALINGALSAFRCEATDGRLMAAMNILNVAVFLFTLGLACRLVRGTRLTPNMQALTVALLFFSFPFLKSTGYYPFSVDGYAFALGLAQLVAFVEKRPALLAASSLAGAFTWPTLFALGLILLCFPRAAVPIGQEAFCGKLDAWLLKWGKRLVPCVPEGWAVLMFAAWYPRGGFRAVFRKGWMVIEPQNVALFVCALVALWLFIFAVVRPIKSGPLYLVRDFFSKADKRKLAGLVAALALLKGFLHVFRAPTDVWGAFGFLNAMTLRPVTDVLVFLANNFAYYGLIVSFVLLFYKPFLSKAAELGYGFLFVIVASLALSINTEARQLITFIPFWAYTLARVFEERRLALPAGFVVCLALVNLALSRFWYPINVEGIAEAFSKNAETFVSFPAQRLFMNLGPWQNHNLYLVFFAAFVLATAGLALGLKRCRRAAEADRL